MHFTKQLIDFWAILYKEDNSYYLSLYGEQRE
jgi:hypothetical protein